MTYNGKVTIGGVTCTYELKDYVLTVVSETDNFLGWDNLRSILDSNEWLCLTDNDSNTLHLKIDNIDWSGKRKYYYNVAGYLITYNRYNPTTKAKEIKPFSFEHTIIRHDVLDYFFKHDKAFPQRVAMLLQNWNPDSEEKLPPCRPSHSICINNLTYTLSFHVMIEGADTPFPYQINNAMDIFGDLSNNIDDLWKIINTIRLFLKFISQSPYISFDKEIRVYNGNDINECNSFFYLRPEKDYTIHPRRVLDYNYLKDGIGNIINLISSNKIYFRSLFCVDTDYITYSDIMNVCAAFESQYNSLYGDFKNKQQSNVKKKMIKLITDQKASFANDELSYYEDILQGFKNYRDSLKQRLESALSEFVEIYGDIHIQCDFEQNYADMPTRIKDARNALDHGNRNYSITYNAYWDSELLRAITYMLILKQANIPEKCMKPCLQKLSKSAL